MCSYSSEKRYAVGRSIDSYQRSVETPKGLVKWRHFIRSAIHTYIHTYIYTENNGQPTRGDLLVWDQTVSGKILHRES